jgi:hypothetical protein
MNHRLVPVQLAWRSGGWVQRARASAYGAFLATLLVAPVACKSKEAAQPVPPGLLDENGRQIVAPRPKPVEPTEATPQPEAPTVYDFERATTPPDPGALSARPPPTGLSPGAALGAGLNDDAGGPARDLNGELSGLLSPLSSCVDVAQAALQPDGRLTIAVTAYVQATGRVSRATVTAPGQSSGALSCMEKQVVALALRGPVPNAPTQVTGSTQLQIRAARTGGGQPPAPNAYPIAAQPSNADMAKPDPGETAGPP